MGRQPPADDIPELRLSVVSVRRNILKCEMSCLMAKQKKNANRDERWAEAKRRCRLSAEHVRMAKELGLNPLSLIKNIPSPKQQWKLPVCDWIEEMYGERKGIDVRKPEPRALVGNPAPERRRAAAIEIDHDFIMDLQATIGVPLDDEFIAELMEDLRHDNEQPDENEIEEQRRRMMERQRRFVVAAEWVARELATLPAVVRIVLFGSAANPLVDEIPRFRQYRRWHVAVPHECRDVDMAVWLDDFSQLRSVQKAKARALDAMACAEGFHVAHHEVDMFLHHAADGAYAGRLCQFAACPKGKAECNHEECGRISYLKHVDGFVMRPEALSPEKSRVLFERVYGESGGTPDDSCDK